MFNIAICDDEETLIDELKENLIKYAAETNKEFCFFIYHDGSELLQEYRSDYDLIFMDIKMEKLNGLKTAEEIRKMDSTVGLIFLTSLKKYVWRGYEYGAVNYLLKPVKYSVLKMELDRYFARYQGKDEPYMSFQNDSGKYKVLYKNLCYAETEKRNVVLHFEGQQQRIYKNMKEVSALLLAQPQFASPHQSFVVNMAYVKSVESLELVMITGERIPISQPKRKDFMMKLTDFWGGYAVMGLYYCLDFIGTLTEALFLYTFNHCFLKQPRFTTPICKWITPTTLFALSWLLTWFSELGAYKTIFLIACIFIVLKLCYKDSIYQMLTAMEIWFMSVCLFPEAMGMAVATWIYGDGGAIKCGFINA